MRVKNMYKRLYFIIGEIVETIKLFWLRVNAAVCMYDIITGSFFTLIFFFFF